MINCAFNYDFLQKKITLVGNHKSENNTLVAINRIYRCF